MFRQLNSTMTAVEIVSARYDGPIPANVMMEARAEDARFAAENPDYRPAVPSAIEEARIMVSYYAEKVRSLINAKRYCDAAGIVNSAWKPFELRMWFNEWRKERRRLAVLLAKIGSAG